MKSKTLIIFAVVTLAMIVAATMVSRYRAPATTTEKQLLFPELMQQVNSVSTLEISKHDMSLSLTRNDSLWLIRQADNYPANFGKIRETVISVAELMVLSEKTSNPELYGRLGVEPPEEPESDSLFLSLSDENGNTLAGLIVGNSRHSKSAEDKPGLYVRLPESSTALLVEGRLDVSAEIRDWFERDLFDIDADRISNIRITHAQQKTVELNREKDVDDFSLANIPEGMEIQSNVIISRMGTLLEAVRADGVISADKLGDTYQSTAEITTFDGLTVTINSSVKGDTSYSIFSFSAEESGAPSADSEDEGEDGSVDEPAPTPAEEANTLNNKLAGWAYAIPDYKFELFTKKQDKLIREPAGTEDSSADENQPVSE